MCTRCVRVCEEVAKDPVLTVSERGNLNEIAVAPGRQLDHNYSLMTEVVCPVGALTSHEFRFKARVWFLRSVRSVCVGCATGCNSFTDYDPRDLEFTAIGLARIRTSTSTGCVTQDAWTMRRIHQGRILEPRVDGESVPRRTGLEKAADLMRDIRRGRVGNNSGCRILAGR